MPEAVTTTTSHTGTQVAARTHEHEKEHLVIQTWLSTNVSTCALGRRFWRLRQPWQCWECIDMQVAGLQQESRDPTVMADAGQADPARPLQIHNTHVRCNVCQAPTLTDGKELSRNVPWHHVIAGLGRTVRLTCITSHSAAKCVGVLSAPLTFMARAKSPQPGKQKKKLVMWRCGPMLAVLTTSSHPGTTAPASTQEQDRRWKRRARVTLERTLSDLRFGRMWWWVQHCPTRYRAWSVCPRNRHERRSLTGVVRIAPHVGAQHPEENTNQKGTRL